MPNFASPGETIIVLDEFDGTKQADERIAFSQGANS